ncbi:6-phosphogluconolactonase [Porphyridium purpureum]|uniref:6-phosphogluconolactonase n=1 Tax=Porphyridium purpureum TaxID=35688 RepID=A0A5J4Z5L1_PORPP|nr:6-phosphogluconolactonase [Porphyridium purpureum]|eukprot:POR6359..scf295_1
MEVDAMPEASRGRVLVYVSGYSDHALLAHQPHGTEASGVSGFLLDVDQPSLKPLALGTGAGEQFSSAAVSGKGCAVSDACPNPAFMKVYDDNLYVVNERIDTNGKVFQFKIDRQTGALNLQSQTDAAGRSTCYVVHDAQRRFALVVNYWDATVSTVHLNVDGTLGSVADVHRRPGYDYCQDSKPDRREHLARRQGWSHTHCVVPAPEREPSRFALYFVPDLGEECVHQLVLDRETGRLAHRGALLLQAGHGPRHFVFHPCNQVAYVVNELDSTVDVLQFDASVASEIVSGGVDDEADTSKVALRVVQTISTIPKGYVGKTHCAEIKVGPDGRFLYVANRFSDTLAVFRIEAEKGHTLSLVEIVPSGGKTPRHFSFDPSGRVMVVANTDNDTLSLFFVHPTTGLLINLDKNVYAPSPNYVLVVPEMVPTAAPVSRMGA